MYIMVFVTTSTPEEAENIAKKIVEEKTAACVNIIREMSSIYYWNNKIERASECLLIIKTTYERYSLLEKTIIENHSYKNPEIIGIKIERGAEKYLHWIGETLT